MDEEELERVQAESIRHVQEEIARAKARRQKTGLQAQKSHLLSSMINARLRQGLTQQHLADKLNMPQSVIGRIESGKGNPSLNTLLKIAQALDTNLSM